MEYFGTGRIKQKECPTLTIISYILAILAILVLLPFYVYANPNNDLLEASSQGDIDAVRHALKAHADPDIKNSGGMTPLIIAASKGHFEIVKLLLEEGGTNVNATANKGFSALMHASYNGYVNIVALLLEKGANAGAHADNGQTALDFATKKKHIEIIRLLKSKAALTSTKNVSHVDAMPNNNLLKASSQGDVDAVRHALKAHTDLEIKNAGGMTPLIIAASKGHLEIVKLLLEEGNANVNATANKGFTALMHASYNGYVNIVTLLLEKGADVTVHTDDGRTALDFAMKKDHEEIVRLLKNNAVVTPAKNGSVLEQQNATIYWDKNNYFAATQPPGWKQQDFPTETIRSKVAFRHPKLDAGILVIAGLVPNESYSLDALLAENQQKIETILKPKFPNGTFLASQENIGDKEAVVVKSSVPGIMEHISTVYINQGIYYNITCTAKSKDDFEVISGELDTFMMAFTMFDPTKTFTKEEIKSSTISHYMALAELYEEQREFADALSFVSMGLSIEPENPKLLKLQERLKSSDKSGANVVVSIDGKELNDSEAQEVMDRLMKQSEEQTASSIQQLSEISANQLDAQRHEMLTQWETKQRNAMIAKQMEKQGGVVLFPSSVDEAVVLAPNPPKSNPPTPVPPVVKTDPQHIKTSSTYADAQKVLDMYVELVKRRKEATLRQGELTGQKKKTLRVIEGAVKLAKDAEGHDKIVAIDTTAKIFLIDDRNMEELGLQNWIIELDQHGITSAKKE